MAEKERNGYLFLEIACALYARDLSNLGRAAELAGVPKITFGQEVGRRGIARHHTDAELEADFGERGHGTNFGERGQRKRGHGTNFVF